MLRSDEGLVSDDSRASVPEGGFNVILKITFPCPSVCLRLRLLIVQEGNDDAHEIHILVIYLEKKIRCAKQSSC